MYKGGEDNQRSQAQGWLKLATPGSFGGILLQHLSNLQVQYPLLHFSVHYVFSVSKKVWTLDLRKQAANQHVPVADLDDVEA